MPGVLQDRGYYNATLLVSGYVTSGPIRTFVNKARTIKRTGFIHKKGELFLF